jgi:excisionase family DNA binding protein
MTRALRERLEEGTPFRLGEAARLLGFSREHLRKMADAGVLKTTEPHRPRAHRRVTAEEVARFAREYGLV